MGGNALSEGLTERKQRGEYLRVKEAVLAALKRQLLLREDESEEGVVLEELSEIVEMPEKQSFGDLDLLYVPRKGQGREEVYSLVRRLFSPTEIVTHGDVTSFDYMTFQIDLIKCTHDTFAMGKFCLSFGDRGMILGQMAKCRGFSLGVKGLIVTHSSLEELLGYRNKNIQISSKKKIVLTRDPVAIRSFMGLPPESDDETLTSQEDVMEFCKKSPWFRPQYFAPRKLNNCESKKKLRLRPFYNKFCEQIAYEYNLESLPKMTEEEKAIDLENRLQNIREGLEYFDKMNEVEDIRVEQERIEDVRAKLNYKHLVALGVTNRNIGKARKSFTEWLLSKHKEENEVDHIFQTCDNQEKSQNVKEVGSGSDSNSDREEDSLVKGSDTLVREVILNMPLSEVLTAMSTWYKQVWEANEVVDET